MIVAFRLKQASGLPKVSLQITGHKLQSFQFSWSGVVPDNLNFHRFSCDPDAVGPGITVCKPLAWCMERSRQNHNKIQWPNIRMAWTTHSYLLLP